MIPQGSAPAALMPVDEALRRVLATAATPLETEMIALAQARGRTLSQDLSAIRTQPPSAVSAMDGYALRAADSVQTPASLRLVGESAAGRGFAGLVGPGEAARIFTGAPVPAGADVVIMQENARAAGGYVVILQGERAGRNIRAAGLDFRAGEVLLRQGTRLGARHLGLAAAMNHALLPVTRKPRVAILATGDELVLPGTEPGPSQIVTSNSFALAAMIEAAGGDSIDLGIAGDSLPALSAAISRAQAQAADVLVTLGGASVGDHDLVQKALALAGMALEFWKIALRPGKPLMHGRIGPMRVLGLPGNPVSAIVCGLLFGVPLVRALSGDPQAGDDPSQPAVLGADLPANDTRRDYMRARLTPCAGSLPLATPENRQDSSMLRVLTQAECLIIREPHAPAARQGEAVRIIDFSRFQA